MIIPGGMKVKKYTNEFKVGVFVLICLLGFLYISAKTGKVNIKGKKGYFIYVTFNEIAGLDVQAPVMLNGMEVGKLDAIDILDQDGTTKIKLKLWLSQDAKIRSKPAISIKTLGLMGEKYIQIASNAGNGFINAGTILEGSPYVDMDVLFANVNTLTEEIRKLSTNLNYTVESNQDKISSTITHLESASINMDEFTQDIKQHPWKLLFKTKEK